MESVRKFPIESLLSARQLVAAKIYGDYVYFLSNMTGSFSLYRMKKQGSIPVPLIPEGVILPNPQVLKPTGSDSFEVFPELDIILIIKDDNGNELYQPYIIPLNGGFPEPLFGNEFKGMQLAFYIGFQDTTMAYFGLDNRKDRGVELFSYNFKTKVRKSFGRSDYGNYLQGMSLDHTKVVYMENYGTFDNCGYLFDTKINKAKLLYGTPLDQRDPEKPIEPNGIRWVYFVEKDTAIICLSIIYSDKSSITWLSLDNPQHTEEVSMTGLPIPTFGELDDLIHLERDQYYLLYNVDGVTHCYECFYRVKRGRRFMEVTKELIGNNTPLNNGVKLSLHHDSIRSRKDRIASEMVVSFTKATVPSQLYFIDMKKKSYTMISDEHIIGISEEYLSEGEDASYTSFDGLRISARLYLPSPKLKFSGPRPLVLYVHGGPQSQEIPNFARWSMPMIQYLALNGFAVFVPNVRGSSGYGHKYRSLVDRDWGGDDMKDHITALEMLKKDKRIDSTKRAVMGRSYGGYMTLMLVSKHPELWSAACDMFGMYDLIGFYNRLPPSWQTYFDIALGNPEKNHDFMVERSPKTYFDNITAPLLVVQGANDPRITLEESKEIFETLKSKGKTVDMIVFEDEGHDVVKYENKLKVYREITEYFKKHLMS